MDASERSGAKSQKAALWPPLGFGLLWWPHLWLTSWLGQRAQRSASEVQLPYSARLMDKGMEIFDFGFPGGMALSRLGNEIAKVE